MDAKQEPAPCFSVLYDMLKTKFSIIKPDKFPFSGVYHLNDI